MKSDHMIFEADLNDRSMLNRVLHPDRLSVLLKGTRTPVLRTSAGNPVYHQKDKVSRCFIRNPTECAMKDTGLSEEEPDQYESNGT